MKTIYNIQTYLSIVIFYTINLGGMAHNVPAVYDVLPARIRALRSKDQDWQNVPEQRRGNGAKRNDLAVVEAEPPTGGESISRFNLGCYTLSINIYI
jgi:hypothetical protein